MSVQAIYKSESVPFHSVSLTPLAPFWACSKDPLPQGVAANYSKPTVKTPKENMPGFVMPRLIVWICSVKTSLKEAKKHNLMVVEQFNKLQTSMLAWD